MNLKKLVRFLVYGTGFLLLVISLGNWIQISNNGKLEYFKNKTVVENIVIQGVMFEDKTCVPALCDVTEHEVDKFHDFGTLEGILYSSFGVIQTVIWLFLWMYIFTQHKNSKIDYETYFILKLLLVWNIIYIIILGFSTHWTFSAKYIYI